MIFDVVFTQAAERHFERLSLGDRERVEAAIDQLALTGVGDVRPLARYPGEYRLRVGAIRVRFTIDRDAGWVVIGHILPRGRAYRN